MKSNVLKSIFFMVIFLSMGSVDAKAVKGEEAQVTVPVEPQVAAGRKRPATAELKGTPPAKRQRIEQPAPVKPAATTAAAQPEVVARGAAGAGVGAPAQPQDWMTWIMTQSIPWSDAVQTQVNQVWGELSLGQQQAIRNYYNTQIELQQRQLQVQQMQQQMGVGPVKPVETVEAPLAPAAEKGWFANLFDYESYLTKYLPKVSLTTGQAVAATAATTAAAMYLGPVVAAGIAASSVAKYITVMGALKTAGTAYALDRIGYALEESRRTGNIVLSESGAIEAIKNLLEQRISDDGVYPTFAIKIEALRNGKEFSSLGKVDDRIFNLARQQVIAAIQKKAADIFAQDPKEKARQESITTLVNNYRKQYTGKITEYINYLEQGVNMNDLQARLSEYLRNKNKIAQTIEEAKLKQLEAIKAAAEKKAAEAKKAAAEEKPYFTMGG